MKWLDDKVNKAVTGTVADKVKSLEITISNLESELKYLRQITAEQRNEIIVANALAIDDKENSEEQIRDVRSELTVVRENALLDYRRLGLKIDEQARLSREDMENALTGLMKILDKKLDLLGDKKTIVTELLKKIASLEK